MQLKKIVEALEQIAPTTTAEPWDNVGLLAGDPVQEISRILFTIDYTPAVAEEGRSLKADLVVAYHPPLFHPLKRLIAPSPIFDAIRRGIALYSPHTALDVADGGTNDMLADALGLTDCRPLKLPESKPTHYKLVVFVPPDSVEQVASALFAAGAGQIGNYAACSFRTAGTGTFFGEADSDPAVGQSGRLEKVAEFRLEMVVPISQVDRVIHALKFNHPYEEPAFDLNVLAPVPSKGQGRIGSLPHTPRSEIFDRIKRELGVQHLLITGPADGTITRAAACPGSCGALLDDAIKAKADLYLTGEIRHHDAIKAAASGITVVCTLHSNSERPVLKRLAQRLGQTQGMPLITVSSADRDPIAIW
jgi:dinuclear metal center YbgI/SA1388 family protein